MSDGVTDGTAEIAVSLNGLEEVAGTLEEILGDLVGELEELFGEVAAVAGSWEGEARDACVALLGDWEGKMGDLRDRQRWLRHVVGNAHANYRAAHRAVLSGWGA